MAAVFRPGLPPVPDARIEILDGVGHTPMIEDPDTAGALLHGFALQTAPR
ncbi:hypothetical protein [Streptomyces sp. NPDC005969]